MEHSSSTREQIDGLVVHGQLPFLVQAKYTAKPVDFEPIAVLDARVRQRLDGVFGLLVSYNGFTRPAVESAMLMNPQKVLLVRQLDLAWGVENRGMFEMIRRRWILAIQYGRPYVDVTDFES